jgi:hypothetical protein
MNVQPPERIGELQHLRTGLPSGQTVFSAQSVLRACPGMRDWRAIRQPRLSTVVTIVVDGRVAGKTLLFYK